uniref:NADH dehydrogenase [ubiquinone] 1 beta subcomplex subunit 1 n=2 Tax=Aotus nancymaae TaxID=37293 RepID=A0A2K5D2H0_AOTNA
VICRRHPSAPCGRGEWQVPRSQLLPGLLAEFSLVLGVSAIMVNFLQLVRDQWVVLFVPMGFVLGCYLDRKNDEKLTAFRNKSMLYKRELRPNEEYTWK